MSERMRQRAQRLSMEDTMFAEGKKNYYKVIDKETGKVVASDQGNSSGFVEVSGESVVTHPYGDGITGSAHSLKNVRVESDRIVVKK